MNENYKELKRRVRQMAELLPGRGVDDLAFVQALDRVRRAAKHGDSGREPSIELQRLLERAEALARALAG